MTIPRMMRVGAVDFSLTATGIGVITRRVSGECSIHTTTLKSKGSLKDPLPQKFARLDAIAHEILYALGNPDLAIMESLSFGSKGLLDRLWAGWWITLGCLVKAGIPVATVSPTSLKLAIAGKAQVDKSVLGRHLMKLWPDLEYANDNEADGGALAHLGAVALGWQVPTLARHRRVKWTEWPEFGPAVQLVELPGDRRKETVS